MLFTTRCTEVRFTSFLSGGIITAIVQGIPAFRDFTIRDPLYFVIQFQALNLWIPLHFMILKKKIPKKNFFSEIFSEKILNFQLFWIAFCLYTVIAIT